MVRYSLPIALFLLVTAATRADEPATDWGPVLKGLQMSSRVERSRYRADEPIMVEVVIKNTSKEVVFLGMSVDDQASFEVVVSLNESGAGGLGRMPLTKYGAWRFAPLDAAKNIPIRLKEGEERRYRFPLNRMYDMTLDGNYSVVINRSIPGRSRYDSDGHMPAIEGDKPDELVSNKLIVVISDSAPQN
jgi:hypothetical protein